MLEDSEDLASIYANNLEYVWRLLRRLGVHERDLEDMTHEVFVVVHRKLPTFDRSREVRPWVAGIAVRVASDYRRSARLRRVKVGTDGLESAAATRGPHAELESSRKRQLVNDALDRLSDDAREVFVMHELEGYTVPEIASILGVPKNTLYTRLRAARRRFADTVRKLRGGSHGK